MKQLLIYLLFLPAIAFPGRALAQKSAPASVITGQVVLDSTQDSLITAATSKADAALSGVGSTSSVANSALATANSATATGAGNTTAIGAINTRTSNLDNTADVNKPVSGPQQTALNKKGDDKQVNNYNELVALGAVTVITTVMVLADEKRNDTYTVYKLYPSGKRIFLVTLEDN